MEISSQMLFNAIKEDPKNIKAIIKAISNPDIVISKKTIGDVFDKINPNKALEKIFIKLGSGTISKSQALKEAEPLLKLNSSSDIKELVKLVQKEPLLQKHLKPLVDFAKHISSVNAKDFKQQVVRSGVGLESKISSLLKEANLPQDLKVALNEFLSLKKNVKSVEIAKEILNKKEVLRQDVKILRDELAKELKSLPKFSKDTKSNLKILDKMQEILTKFEKIPNAKQHIQREIQNEEQKNIQTQSQKISSKELPREVHKEIYKEAQKEAKKEIVKEIVKESPKEILKDLAKENAKTTNVSNFKTETFSKVQHEIKAVLNTIKDSLKIQNDQNLANQEIKVLIKEVENLLDTSEQNSVLQSQNLKNEATIVIKSIDIDLNLQDKIKLLTSRMKQSLELNQKGSLEVFSEEKNIKNLIKTIDKQLANLPSFQGEDIKKEIAQDIKKTLLQLKESPNKEISNLSNRLIVNIETNQLISIANNSINTYIPYLWEDLRDGNISFKSQTDDSFFCRLDLNLKIYGKVDIMIMLTNNSYISLNIACEKDELKQKVNENLKELRKALSDVGLIPLHLKTKAFERKSFYDSEGWSKYSVNLKA